MPLRNLILGEPLDPFKAGARRHVAWVAFLAWVGLAANGLSSVCYGPEQAFLALGSHEHLGLYLALATALTVFIIALAYNQVIALFPSGGGGYKVATRLLGPRAGLVSGAALLVDYVLTIAISVAAGGDALFSLLPATLLPFKLTVEALAVLLLLVLNLRGLRESLQLLVPIVLGFFLTHVLLVGYGIWAHAEGLPSLVPASLAETRDLSRDMGWMFVVAFFLRAYSLGGATYTGLEVVSNNVNMLAEPRVRNGKFTMLFLALSMALLAGGVILLYLLWGAEAQIGKTLNAVVFQDVIASAGLGAGAEYLLWAVILLEVGLLLLAANTGFLGGPGVMANMASDSWAPRQFRQLSNRLVTQNGILMMGIAALIVLLWTDGRVALLVVLYSINVFLAFSLSLAGLCLHWWRRREVDKNWRRHLAMAALGFLVTFAILLTTLVEKFTEGGWVTLLITGLVVAIGTVIRRHYEEVRQRLREADALFAEPTTVWNLEGQGPKLDRNLPTAVFLVGQNKGVGMHALLWVQRLFPGHFRNFVFLGVGEVDSQSYDAEGALRTLKYKVDNSLHDYVSWCHNHGLAAEARSGFGTEPVEELTRLSEAVAADYGSCVFFASKLVFEKENALTRLLHNQVPIAMQRQLHLRGLHMVILPMKI